MGSGGTSALLTMREKEKLEALMTLIEVPQEGRKNKKSQIDVSERNRDELGRFEKEEALESDSGREIILVKVKGSYGTYLVRDKITWKDRLFIFVVLFIIFIIGKAI